MGIATISSFFVLFVLTLDFGDTKKINFYPQIPDFVSENILPDGEVEKRIFSGGIWIAETTAFGVNSSALRLRQMSDGRHLTQFILDSERNVVDCEYSKDVEVIEEFLNTFDRVKSRARMLAEDKAQFEVGPRVRETLKLATSVEEKFNYKQLKAECKKVHRRMKELKKNGRRQKRDLFIYPGTNWCGIGAMTEKYNELGFNAAADRCCRQHDHCPHVIEGFTSKYHIFNYRFHTISLCDCDERFRTCLKMANNAASNMVGKLYFNVVQMKCFVLKSEKTCGRRSWWGKCVKYEMNKVAHVRDPLHF